MIELAGYGAAFLMGAVLGLIGSGGSILTVPILVYLMGVAPVTATAYSLLIVGATAALGAARYYRRGMVNVKAALVFAIPSIIAVYLTRAFVMPALPDPLIDLAGVTMGKDSTLMILFALLMIVSAFMMLRKGAPKKQKPETEHNKTDAPHHPGLIVIEGAVVGVATGLLGAGGGFLIIPALVLLMGMPMKEAIGASLFIIALKSLIGFIGDLQNGIELAFPMLGLVILATFAGMWSAVQIADKFNSARLQKIFSYFLFIIAAFILFSEL